MIVNKQFAISLTRFGNCLYRVRSRSYTLGSKIFFNSGQLSNFQHRNYNKTTKMTPTRDAPDTTVDTWMPQNSIDEHIQGLLKPVDGKKSPINYILAFTQIISYLKKSKRTGWIDNGIPSEHVESIADHMYRMSILTMIIPNDKIEIDRCVKIAIIHDIAEALVGDITPFGGVTKAEKHRRELTTIQYLSSLIEPYNKTFAHDIVELWLDYEEIRSIEARYVKDIDKLEMIQQAWEYEQKFGLKYDLSEFYTARPAIKTPEISALADEIIKQRNDYVATLKEGR